MTHLGGTCSLLMELERAHLSRVHQPDAMEIVRDLQA